VIKSLIASPILSKGNLSSGFGSGQVFVSCFTSFRVGGGGDGERVMDKLVADARATDGLSRSMQLLFFLEEHKGRWSKLSVTSPNRIRSLREKTTASAVRRRRQRRRRRRESLDLKRKGKKHGTSGNAVASAAARPSLHYKSVRQTAVE